MSQLPEIHGDAGGLADVKGSAKIRGVWANFIGGVWAKIEKVGKECMFVGKGVISLGKEILFIRSQPKQACCYDHHLCARASRARCLVDSEE